MSRRLCVGYFKSNDVCYFPSGVSIHVNNHHIGSSSHAHPNSKPCTNSVPLRLCHDHSSNVNGIISIQISGLSIIAVSQTLLNIAGLAGKNSCLGYTEHIRHTYFGNSRLTQVFLGLLEDVGRGTPGYCSCLSLSVRHIYLGNSRLTRVFLGLLESMLHIFE